jgi:teichuronic acid biosynthesis glycosyltransferase TuaG
MKTVTVVIPTYNRGDRIEHTLTSVVDQDYRKVEIIVVDDGSTDATETIVKKVAGRIANTDKRIRYFRQDNQGACVARNIGMALSKGFYIVFLDSDDLLDKKYLTTQVTKIEADNSQCAICDFRWVDGTGRLIGNRKNSQHPHEFIRTLASPHISTVLMRRDSIPPGLQWDARLKRIQDMDFVFKYFATISRWSYVNQTLFTYFLHDGERISDSYYKGFQYGILRESFKSFLEENKSFISTDPTQLYRSYMWALRKHQLKNGLVKITPSFLKKLRKGILSTRDHDKHT